MHSSHLLHPELFEHTFLGERMADTLNARAYEVNYPTHELDAVSILIRSRNDAANLEIIFDEIAQQDFRGETEVILVDTESSDGTVQLAKRSGAEVVKITQDEFTYPLSLNRGMAAASNEAVFVTVGHANLSNRQILSASLKHIADPTVGGAYGLVLPGKIASRTERLIAPSVLSIMGRASKIPRIRMGVLGATGAVIRKDTWAELQGFDERFEAGGEDTDLAKRMLNANYAVVRDPALSVHHSHGLGPINSLRQVHHWGQILKGPQILDKSSLARRRPDLELNS